eukprot:2213966-Amphidinium_carterae.1
MGRAKRVVPFVKKLINIKLKLHPAHQHQAQATSTQHQAQAISSSSISSSSHIQIINIKLKPHPDHQHQAQASSQIEFKLLPACGTGKFENSFAHHPPSLMPCIISDWVDEQCILTYFNEAQGQGEPGFEEAKQSAAKFLLWLKTAESEDSDSPSDG